VTKATTTKRDMIQQIITIVMADAMATVINMVTMATST
jgi:hypothetical protein